MRVFRLTTLIAEKALREGKSESAISEEVAELLEITPIRFGAIRRQSGGKIDVVRLVAMADYFGVSLDELINPAFKHRIINVRLNAPAKV